MATNTYTALKTTTVGTAVSSVTIDLTGITGYTDLILVSNIIASTNAYTQIQVGNGSIDTGSNYSWTYLFGSGSGTASGRNANQTFLQFIYTNGSTPTANITQFMNYAGSTYKTILNRNSNTVNGVEADTGLWRSTSAINLIKLTQSSGTMSTGSTFTVYGIAAAPAWAAKATGGTITYGVGYTYHTFTSSGTFTPSQNLSCDYLVVAGGGAGGGSFGGGGGAGGYRTALAQSFASGVAYTTTVGAGGSGGAGTGTSGADSSISGSGFTTFTSTGGGYGGGSSAGVSGASGGSGGGTRANGYGSAGLGNTPSTSPSQGNDGGSVSGTGNVSSGGGGAGATGGAASGTSGGTGGDGLYTAISGGAITGAGQLSGGNYYFAGGGGGISQAGGTVNAGGLGGGGTGVDSASSAGVNATANTGGGGGGNYAGSPSGNGGNGGSGIVIIRYAN